MYASSVHCIFTMLFFVLLFYVHGKHLRSCRDGYYALKLMKAKVQIQVSQIIITFIRNPANHGYVQGQKNDSFYKERFVHNSLLMRNSRGMVSILTTG